MYLLLGSLFIISLSLYYFFSFIDWLLDFIDNRPNRTKNIVENIFTIITFILMLIFVFVFGHLIF